MSAVTGDFEPPAEVLQFIHLNPTSMAASTHAADLGTYLVDRQRRRRPLVVVVGSG